MAPRFKIEINRFIGQPEECEPSRHPPATRKKIQAFLLADIVGSRMLRFKRELNSTKALTDMVWNTAARLGYSGIFVNEGMAIEDDHLSFLKRGVPCVDVIDLEIPYWHTPQDTLDKISAKSLAITGHVLLETIKQMQAK